MDKVKAIKAPLKIAVVKEGMMTLKRLFTGGQPRSIAASNKLSSDDIGNSEEHMGNQPGRESKDLREDRTEQREDNPPADTNDNIGGKHGNLV